jgi:hypothetical protein
MTEFNSVASQPQHKKKQGLVRNLVVGQCASIFELFPFENKSLLVRRNAVFVADYVLEGLDCVVWISLQRENLIGIYVFNKQLHLN